MNGFKMGQDKVAGLLSEDAYVRSTTVAMLAAKGPGAFDRSRELLRWAMPWCILMSADQPAPSRNDARELYPWALRVASIVQVCRAAIEHARTSAVSDCSPTLIFTFLPDLLGPYNAVPTYPPHTVHQGGEQRKYRGTLGWPHAAGSRRN